MHGKLTLASCGVWGAPVGAAGLLGGLAQVLQHVAVVALELADARDACAAHSPVAQGSWVTCQPERP